MKTLSLAAPVNVTAFVLSLSILSVARSGGAYTLDSQVTEACHEQITAQAMAIVRQTLPDAARVTAVGDETSLVESLPFRIPTDMGDLGSATLLIANRDVDLEGGRATDTTRLPQIHSNPATQDHHCLRGFDDDEPDGAARALTACRARIRERALAAAALARADGTLDVTARVGHRTDIAFRGPTSVSLPPGLIALGEAMHAVQDGFAHVYRTADGMRVVTILNFVDPVAGRDEPSRDGPGHLAGLDRCDDPDERRTLRRQLAGQASAELALLVLDPAMKDGREAAVDAFLDKYFARAGLHQ